MVFWNAARVAPTERLFEYQANVKKAFGIIRILVAGFPIRNSPAPSSSAAAVGVCAGVLVCVYVCALQPCLFRVTMRLGLCLSAAARLLRLLPGEKQDLCGQDAAVKTQHLIISVLNAAALIVLQPKMSLRRIIPHGFRASVLRLSLRRGGGRRGGCKVLLQRASKDFLSFFYNQYVCM